MTSTHIRSSHITLQEIETWLEDMRGCHTRNSSSGLRLAVPAELVRRGGAPAPSPSAAYAPLAAALTSASYARRLSSFSSTSRACKGQLLLRHSSSLLRCEGAPQRSQLSLHQQSWNWLPHACASSPPIFGGS